MEPAAQTLVGREREREAVAATLAALRSGAGGVLLVEGEPGIGKSRLLAHVAEQAAAGAASAARASAYDERSTALTARAPGHDERSTALTARAPGYDGPCTVLSARASEYEADLPYALWTDALDRHLSGAGERRLARLGLAGADALAAVAPSLAGGAPRRADRHRVHRALRDLLERLAGSAPLVLCLDDVHWADPGSVEALAALLHRPPAAPVLLALAARAGRLPQALTVALAAGPAVRLTLAPLNAAEARELVGAEADAVYADSGGNPFYLEQLARGRGAADAGAGPGADTSVPPAVSAALAAELLALPAAARRLLDAAAVTGDPFEAGLAAEVAELEESAALAALDALLAKGLVREGGAPRRFAFRHPVVRHAVYEAAPGGWRIGAHARAAAALERRGAGPVQRSHHVEQAAQPGDEAAIAVLEAAAGELQSLAPGTAARYYAATLRLLPGGRDPTPVQLRLADAQAAAGDARGARATLLAALDTAPPGDRLRVTVGVANTEWWMGRVEDARRRLHVALGELPAQPSPDRVRLRLALALTALMSRELTESAGQAADARDDARAIGDPVFEAAALACIAVARAVAGEGAGGDGVAAAAGEDAGGDGVAAARAGEGRGDAGAAVEAADAALGRLTREQLATRLPGLWMIARARRALGQFAAALADLERGIAIAADTGRGNVRVQLTIEAAVALVELGRLEEAVATAEQGVEMARLASNPRILLWAHATLASARLAAGDVGAALRHAADAAGTGAEPDFHAAGQPGWALGAALTAAGNPDRAVAAMLESFGGPALPAVLPADRPLAAADLALAQLATGDTEAAEHTLALGEAAADGAGRPPTTTAVGDGGQSTAAADGAGRPSTTTAVGAGPQWTIAVTGAARSALLLELGRADEAVIAARRALEAARDAPLAAARAQLAEGRALAAAGRRAEAREALIAAESRLAGFGAQRLRDEAARELRRLGHRVRRPARETAAGPLTAREREIAELVAAGRTNREIAEQLVLSTRTIEAHLRNVYAKLGVRSRVELTRALASGGAGVTTAASDPSAPRTPGGRGG